MNFERGFSRCSFRFRYTKHWSIACNDKKMVIVKWEELLDTQVVTPLVFLLLFSLEPFGVSSTSGKFLNFKRTIGTEKRRRN